jgi:hypothetical protein
MAKFDRNWWFGKHSIYQKAGIDEVVSSRIFKSGIGGFWTGALSGLSAMLPGWSSRTLSAQEEQTVVQGIPNWTIGLAIVYLAMRK